VPTLSEIQVRDPFVLREGDTYYLFGSTDKDIWRAPGVGFDVYRGAAPGVFTEYEGPFPAFRPPAGFWATVNFWAPEVYAYGGAHHMFATFKPDEGRRGTAVLRSADGPLGPFVPWSDGPVTPAEWECLDGTLFVDDAGDPWMVFCHEWAQVGDGQVCAVRLAPDLRAAAGEPVLLFTASQAGWSAPLAGRAPGSYVTDGPFAHRYADGRLSLLWSSFGPEGNYCIGEATSASGTVEGPWHQRERPLYEADGGHGMLFRSPDGTLYLAIHTPNATPDERPIFVEIDETPQGLVATGTVIS
jgi:hypothetical protein